jgi:putative endonuclease
LTAGRPGAGSGGPVRPSTAVGQRGEDLAVAWYEARGYAVVARNWRTAEGEIDLVARRGRVVVIAEVKARSSDRFGHPAEEVVREKQRRLRRLAAAWLRENKVRGVGVRFDVVAVLAGTVEVLEDAF